MNWTGFWSIFILATVKFSVSAVPGPRLGMTFFETALASFAGGASCALVCYFASDAILMYFKRRAQKKQEVLESQGIQPKVKKKFTRMNKMVIRVKMKFGQVGICFLPAFVRYCYI